MRIYAFAINFFVLINSINASHDSLNSSFASYSSFFIKIAQIEAIGTKIIEQNIDKTNPRISPFFS